MNDNLFALRNKHLIFITAFYITIKLTAFIITYKVTDFHLFTACFSVLIIPVWFLTGDIIAEVYGYETARQLVLIVVICQIIMILLCYLSSHTPSPDIFAHQSEIFKQMFITLSDGAISNSIGIIISGLINARIIILLKTIFKGNLNFLIRCLIANAVAETVFIVIAYSPGFFEVSQTIIIIKLMVTSYIIKLIISPLLIFPAAFISEKLKKIEFSQPTSHRTRETNYKNNLIFTLVKDKVGKSSFVKYNLEMSTVHELGKFSNDYKESNVRFGEFKPLVQIGSNKIKNNQILICVKGEIKITSHDGVSKIFNCGNVIFLDNKVSESYFIETLSECTLTIIDLRTCSRSSKMR